MTENLSYDEFITLTLLYAANVNEEFTKEEQEAIKKNVSEDTYNKVYKIFDGMSDFEALESIQAHKGIHFPTPDRKQEVLDKIQVIFEADHNFDVVEKEIFHFLQKLL